MHWISILQEVGPTFGILFYIMFVSTKREERLEEILAQQNQFIQEELIKWVKRATFDAKRKFYED